ncbi:MAG: DUF805 domain-containing protein [Verrucomicrobiota bacterium]
MSVLLDTRLRRGPVGFFFTTVSTLLLLAAACYGILNTLGQNHHFSALAVFFCIVLAVFASGILLAQFVQRLNDARWPGYFALLSIIPAVNIGLWFLLLVLPSRVQPPLKK